MAVTILPYGAEHEPAVEHFNGRLRRHGLGIAFPGQSTPDWLPPAPGRSLRQEYFIGVDGSANCGGDVRGGYILKHQDFLIAGEVRTIADYRLPLSEGIIDRQYNALGLHLLCDALRRQPLLFALGMGGLGEPLPRMLAAARWGLVEVPFWFRVFRPARFLRRFPAARSNCWRRTLGQMAVATGIASLAGRASAWWRPAKRLSPNYLWHEVSRFDTWADDLWQASQGAYSLAAVRDRRVLESLYPESEQKFIRLQVTKDGSTVGWAVLLATAMHEHKHFGNLVVGTLVDCLALPGDEHAVAASATAALRDRGVDLAVSNQSHAAWGKALYSCGFYRGPSNFVFAASPRLAALVAPMAQQAASFHLTRGDGDGPIHL